MAETPCARLSPSTARYSDLRRGSAYVAERVGCGASVADPPPPRAPKGGSPTSSGLASTQPALPQPPRLGAAACCRDRRIRTCPCRTQAPASRVPRC
jgi:hypothetical protein